MSETQNQVCLSLETPRYLKEIKKNLWNMFKNVAFRWEFGNPIVWQFPKRRAPKKYEDPFNKFLEILDMKSVSIKKHEMAIW